MPQFRFGTVGAPHSTPSKPGGSVGAIQQISLLNLTCLELGWVQSVRVTEETCKAISAIAKEKDVLISVHAPYFINLNATEEEWPKSRKRLMDAAYYGNIAGATDIVFHPGSYFNQPVDQVLSTAITRLEECMIELRQSNNPVRLRPETMGKQAMLGSLQDTLQMSRAIPGVLPCVDFAHIHARPGDGSINTVDEWCRLFEIYALALGDEGISNLHIHLSGIEYTAKGEKNHLPIRESDLRVDYIYEAMRKMGGAGRILCESPEMEEDAIFLRDLWDNHYPIF